MGIIKWTLEIRKVKTSQEEKSDILSKIGPENVLNLLLTMS